MFGHEAALFTPTGSLANLLAVRSLVAPGQEVLCESSAHIARAELGAHGAVGGRHHADLDVAARGQVDLAAISALFAPDMGPFFVRTAAVSVENTHNFAGGAVLPLADLEALRSWADRWACAVHLDGARLWNAHVATGTPLASYGAHGRRAERVLLQGPRRARRLDARRLGSGDDRGARLAQAARWRDAAGRHPGGGGGCTPSTTTSSVCPRTTSTPACSPRRAASTRHAVDTNIVVVDRPDAGAFVAAAREEGVLVSAVAPRRSGWSPTSASASPRPGGRSTCWPGCEVQAAGMPTRVTSLTAV